MTKAVNNCPIERTLGLISGKWKSVILYQLMDHPNCHFSELQKLLPGCSRRMLALQLKDLEEARLISKVISQAGPQIRTTYSLTESGRQLLPIIQGMQSWGANER